LGVNFRSAFGRKTVEVEKVAGLAVGVHASFGQGAVAFIGGQRFGLGLVSQSRRRQAEAGGEESSKGVAKSEAKHGLFKLTFSKALDDRALQKS
jgi:hypothetical protein